MTKKVRVRYAPSPTGHLHIGNARTALFNYLYAKHYNGDFIVRIEDTDLERNIEGGIESQFYYLNWLGIHPDESIDKEGDYGPYRQTERLDIYRKYAAELLEKGHAYRCFCSEKKLQKEREVQMAAGESFVQYTGTCRHLTKEEQDEKIKQGLPYTIRLKVPENKTFAFTDLVRGLVSFDSKDIGDWVIMKANGIPTYNYAVVIDDHLMEISHVFRGEEHLTNTPKQQMLYEMFSWEMPQFGHMTLIVNEQRKKLSKRDESVLQFISQYKDLGYLPEAMFNFIALLGWSPEGEEEIFSKEELIQQFDPTRLSKSPSMFDKQKLAYINNRYMKAASLDMVVEVSLPHLIQAGRLPEKMTDAEMNWARQVIALYQEQMSYGAEIVHLSEMFLVDEIILNAEQKVVLAAEHVPDMLRVFQSKLELLSEAEFTADRIQAAIQATQKETGHKGKNLFMPIRVATTGCMHGRDLPISIALLGREKILARLSSSLK